jgi:hypothetical protein
MCSYCKKVRNDQGSWQAVESYVSAHWHASFSRGMCPDCGQQHFPAVFETAATGGNPAQSSY